MLRLLKGHPYARLGRIVSGCRSCRLTTDKVSIVPVVHEPRSVMREVFSLLMARRKPFGNHIRQPACASSEEGSFRIRSLAFEATATVEQLQGVIIGIQEAEKTLRPIIVFRLLAIAI